MDAPVLWISAANEDGLDALEQTIRDMFEQGMIAGNDEVVITNARQKTCLYVSAMTQSPAYQKK